MQGIFCGVVFAPRPLRDLFEEAVASLAEGLLALCPWRDKARVLCSGQRLEATTGHFWETAFRSRDQAEKR